MYKLLLSGTVLTLLFWGKEYSCGYIIFTYLHISVNLYVKEEIEGNEMFWEKLHQFYVLRFIFFWL